LSDGTTTVGVGLDERAAAAVHEHVGSLDEALELAATVSPTGPAGRSSFALRARVTGGEAWNPVVVLVGAAAEAAEITPAVAASGRSAVALVVAGTVHAAPWSLRHTDRSWSLEPLGLRLVPDAEPRAGGTAPVPGGVAAVAGELLGRGAHELFEPRPTAVAGDRAEVTPAVGPSGAPATISAAAHTNQSASSNGRRSGVEAPAHRSLMVTVLGPVQLVDGQGVANRFERAKALELIAWMATHRGHSTRSAARTALWDVDVRDATFANVVSEARRAMARHAEPPPGDEWLRRTMTEELVLHPAVVSDVDVVRDLLGRARAAGRDEAMEVLRPAVEMVRGVPFAGTGYLWPTAEGISSNLVVLATSVAVEYGRRALEAGDVDGVLWATAKGLHVIAGQEGLIELRMRAHAEAGDVSGVRLEWDAYERVVSGDPWGDGEPAPKLVGLRQELLGR
jgi:hypothetical protein